MESKETTTGGAKKSPLKWKEVTIGGVSGILLGAAGSFAATAATTVDNNEEILDENEENQEEELVEEQGASNANVVAHGNVASGVTDDMSFSEAFAAARSEVGAGGCFVWQGNVYNTYYASEWNAMSSEQQDDFVNMTAGVDTSHSHSYAHHSAAEEHVDTGSDGAGNDDLAVEILGVEQVQHDDGSVSNIGAASINGQAVYFIDVDGENGEFELMASDINANGTLDDDEIVDISDQHMQVSQFEAAAVDNGSASGNEVDDYYASNDNLPDYVNDADPADLG